MGRYHLLWSRSRVNLRCKFLNYIGRKREICECRFPRRPSHCSRDAAEVVLLRAQLDTTNTYGSLPPCSSSCSDRVVPNTSLSCTACKVLSTPGRLRYLLAEHCLMSSERETTFPSLANCRPNWFKRRITTCSPVSFTLRIAAAVSGTILVAALWQAVPECIHGTWSTLSHSDSLLQPNAALSYTTWASNVSLKVTCGLLRTDAPAFSADKATALDRVFTIVPGLLRESCPGSRVDSTGGNCC